MSNIRQLFSGNGLLSANLDGFNVRESQQKLAETIESVIDEQKVLLAEAGTGTGKTFSYLLPAFMNDKKTIISTATKNLQEQLYEHDLPFVKKILKSTKKVALLKGRSNYFCQYHYEQLLQTDANNTLEKKYRQSIGEFADITLDGDLINLKNVPEDDILYAKISSTSENCLGHVCPYFEDCYVQKARKKANESDIIIVNHHLLLADFTLRNDGFAEILPEIESFIIDEAHHLPETATHFLGKRLSHRQIAIFCADIAKESASDESISVDIDDYQKQLALCNNEILRELQSLNKIYIDGTTLFQLKTFWSQIQKINQLLLDLKAKLHHFKEKNQAIANLLQRNNDLIEMLSVFQPIFEGGKTVNASTEQAIKDDKIALWLDVSSKNFILNAVPINAGEQISNWIEQSKASWIFLSATLAVEGDFTHFKRQIGLKTVQTLKLDSPFDFRKQAVLYHPKGMPQPNDPQYTQALINRILPVLDKSKGRAFLLFTSYRALKEAKIALQGMDYELLVQGEAPKTQLLIDFRKSSRAILLATASFWEGVDVRGDQLVCVIIDRLPFATPDDPLTKAKHLDLQAQNLSPFLHDTLPKAVIALKQGVGRLIRGIDDYGVLVIADPRLTEKNYGKVFLASLPRMTRTTDIAVVNRLFDHYE